MKTIFISLSIALLIAALVWASIVVLAPGINYEKALNFIVFSFIGSAILTALVLTLRSRRR